MRAPPAKLLGRDRELAMLEQALDGLGAGSGGCVEISGEPGIGKTRLLGDLCSRADARGHLVLEGRATELERELPFAPFVDALDDYLAALDPPELSGLTEERWRELAAVFPALSDVRQDRGGGVRSERFLLHHAVRALLEELARRQPVVFALDDVHWADGASLELVSYLLRRPPRASVLLALAYRPVQVPPPLARALEAAVRDGRCERIELRPLSRAEAGQLLAEEIDAARADHLYRQSGGNPFYLEQLARGSHNRGRGRSGDGAAGDGDAVPPAVMTALAEEIEALSGDARTLAQAAAVAGEPFEPELVAAIAEISEAEAVRVLDELLAADLIRPTLVPRYFSFRHPIVRGAVYTSAPAGWLIAAHSRAAEVLAVRGLPATSRAHHVERSASIGDERAIAVLTEAGNASAARAPGTAAHWFAAALRLLPETDAERHRRVGLLVARARALAAIGGLEQARNALREALAGVPPDLPAVRALVLAGVARIEGILGDHARAQRLLRGALEELPDPGSPEAVDLKLELVGAAFYSGDFEAMHRWAAEAFEQARAQDDRTLHAAASTSMAGAEYMIGRVEPARALVSETGAVIEEMADEELAARLGSLAWLCWCEVFLERFDDAIEHLERGLDVARATGQDYPLALMHLPKGAALIWQGRLDEADEEIEAAVEGSLLAQADVFLSWALAMRCWNRVLRGEVKTAIRAGEQAVKLAGEPKDVLRVLAFCHLAEARLEAGQPERCRDELLAAAGGPDLPLYERAFRPHWYEVLTRTELALGRLEAAERWVERAEAAADGLGIDGRTAEALRGRAAVLLACGDAGGAAEAALASAEAAERPRNRIEAARSRTLAGRALAAAGEPERAAGELRRAEARLAACGAKRYRDEAARELRRLGRRVAPRARRALGEAGVAALSGREREVAELLTAGKTNRQIAEELFLSEKTVATHLAHIFEKLGASSRAEAAAMVERERAGTVG